MSDLKSKLIENHINAAKGIARRYWLKNQWLDYNTIEASAIYGLYLAAERYKESENNTFLTFATHRMRGQIIDDRRIEEKVNRSVGSPNVPGLKKSHLSAYDHLIVSREKLPEKHFENLSYLSRPERLLIVLYYEQELSMNDIGKTLGVTESRVSQMHADILERLRGIGQDRVLELIDA